MVLWFSGSLVLWFWGSGVLGFRGSVVLSFCGSVVLGFCGSGDEGSVVLGGAAPCLQESLDDPTAVGNDGTVQGCHFFFSGHVERTHNILQFNIRAAGKSLRAVCISPEM